MSVPTMEELYERIGHFYTQTGAFTEAERKAYADSLENMFHSVASGELPPLLTGMDASFAAQVVCCVLEHWKQNYQAKQPQESEKP